MSSTGVPGYPSKRAFTFLPAADFPQTTITLWDNTTPDGGNSIFLQILGNPQNPANIPIFEVYIPIIYGPIAFFLGQEGTSGTPNYTTTASGCETVDFDSCLFLTLQYVNGYPGEPAFVFLRNLPTGAFRLGPVGAQVTSVTASLPLASSGGSTPNISLVQNPLPISYGGTGTNNPQLTAGTGIQINGVPFNWTISATATGIQSISGIAPISITGGPNPVVSLTVVPLNLGGTAQTNPALNAGAGISVTGNIFQPSGANAWTVANTGVTSVDPGALTGDVTLESTDNSVVISKDTGGGRNAVNFSVTTTTALAAYGQLNPAQINGAGATLALPNLPNGSWLVEFLCHGFGLNAAGNQIQAVGTNWTQTASDQVLQVQSTRTLYIAGVVGGGNNPAITVSGTGVTINSGTAFISATLKAIRIA